MMPTPLPTQLSGAKFLAERKNALLADQQRVGKTGAAIMAADYVFARTILVVTTASGRSVWKRGFSTWSNFGRTLQVALPSHKLEPDADVIVVSWGSIATPALRVQLLARRYDLIISDEDHWAKSFDAARTRAFYGDLVEDGDRIMVKTSLASRGDRIWPLTGTPLPNSPLDAYPRLRVLAVDRLLGNPERGWPEVVKFSAFRDRYCKWHPMKIGRGSYARFIDVVTEGKNEEELRERTAGFSLRRTQADVGIRPPIYETFPLIVSDANRRASEAGLDTKRILAAVDNGADLDMELGQKRRLTGEIKARAVIEAITEEFAGGLEKVVLAFWHKDVGKLLLDGLKQFGVVGIDGTTPPATRLAAEESFRDNPKVRVFLGQIVAAGEAIDLSAASELVFVESSFVPKDMAQMSARIANVGRPRSTRVRVATIDGSIDDALQSALLRKWTSIRKVIQ
jgi:SWI/SNF-related matrix-associated actin-dependent regulator 1 of chromatin subfamily A